MNQSTIITSKLPKETEQQYTAWLLYCETGSLNKSLEVWDRVGQNVDDMWMKLAGRLGKKPAHTTIGRWAKRFHWVERRELKIAEDLEFLKDRTKRIKREKVHKIADIFERVLNKKIKQLKEGEFVTMLDLKQAWEMFQVELGKPTNRAQLNTESEQRPLTSEEKEYGKELHKAVAWYIRQEHEKKENIEKTSKKT